MKLSFFNIAVLCSLLTLYSGCKDDNYIEYYGEYMGIEFPKDIVMICMYRISYDSDYTNTSIYRLSDIENQKVINQINTKLCDSITIKKGDCWVKECEMYSLKISDSTYKSFYYIKASIGKINNENLLIIDQVKL